MKPFRALALFLLFAAVPLFSQAGGGRTRIAEGYELYRAGRYAEAAEAFLRILPAEPDYPEALFWTCLARLSEGKNADALAYAEKLQAAYPAHARSGEVAYHKGRILYNLGRYEEALLDFSAYAESDGVKADEKAAALYWAGECLFALGRLDEASAVFEAVVRNFPESSKYEASRYRMELVRQKKEEAELLSILKWSHEESLRTLEEYEAREKFYADSIAEYQKRIAELQGDASAGEKTSEEYKKQLGNAELRLADRENTIRLLSMKTEILALQNRISEMRGGAE
jgi:TolA-binding protein